MVPEIEKLRRELQTRQILAPRRRRVLFVGRSVNGNTDVVACLVRGLRNVGHDCLHLDIGRHPRIAHNPHRRYGGNGPIYVDGAVLRSWIEQFQPDVLVMGAGGYCVDDETLAFIRSRPILYLGMTLSDPDVFHTVKDYAAQFDVHTTNAQHALQMYEEAGIDNTLLFSFAIDRAYVTQEVAPAPELDADVICLGHATARPERDGFMRSVADEVDNVRTYGRGWSLPDSEVVEGSRLIQASRHGKIHVNFAGTRAGYTNVKVGVFETIGSGAVLATNYFDEMKSFFDYEDEIIGYEGAEDLIEKIKRLLAEPERYRAMAIRGFKRLIENHLYEHRWISLFNEIEEKLAAGALHFPTPERKALVETALQGDRGQAKKIIISGFYGAANVGDEAILASVLKGMRARIPNGTFAVGAENPIRTEMSHAVNAFKRNDPLAADFEAMTSSVFLLGGGGLWHDYTFAAAGGMRGFFTGAKVSIPGFGIPALLSVARGAEFHVIGLGVGPLSHPDARNAVRFLAGHAQSIWVRDDESFDILAELGVENVTSAPDLVYGAILPPPAEDAGDARPLRIGVNVRKWARGDGDWMQAIADALDAVADEHPDVEFVGMPMQEGKTHDRAALSDLYALMRHGDKCQTMEEEATLDAVCRRIDTCDVVVAMRLHACLLAHRRRCSAVGLSYDPKVQRHFEELGLGERSADLGDLKAALGPALGRVLAEGRVLPAAADVRLTALEDAAQAELDRLAERIKAAPVSTAVYGLSPTPARHEEAAKAAGGAVGGAIGAAAGAVGSAVRNVSAQASGLRDSVRRNPAAMAAIRARNGAADGFVEVQRPYSARNAPTDVVVRLPDPETPETDDAEASATTAGDGALAFKDRKALDFGAGAIQIARDGQARDDLLYSANENAHWLSMRFDERNPRRGDRLTWRVPVPASSERGRLLELEIETPYINPTNLGYLETFVAVDGHVFLREDIAVDLRTRSVSIILPAGPEALLEIGVRARRDCTRWNWSLPSTVVVRNLTMSLGDDVERPLVNCDSPFARVAQLDATAQRIDDMMSFGRRGFRQALALGIRSFDTARKAVRRGGPRA